MFISEISTPSLLELADSGNLVTAIALLRQNYQLTNYKKELNHI
jgi:hypothetical protein